MSRGCGSASRRYKNPMRFGGAVLRRHQCRSCRLNFLSAQQVVTPAAAEVLITASGGRSALPSKTPPSHQARASAR